MKTILNSLLILALAVFATRVQAQDTGDIRNSYNNDLPWTSEPEGVVPGSPAPPIEVVGIEDARDIQDYSNIEQSMDAMATMPPATTLTIFSGGDPGPARGFHGSSGGDRGSHDVTGPDKGGGRRR